MEAFTACQPHVFSGKKHVPLLQFLSVHVQPHCDMSYPCFHVITSQNIPGSPVPFCIVESREPGNEASACLQCFGWAGNEASFDAYTSEI